MTIDEFLLTCRSRLDDEVRPYLWNNADLISYANRRINEFARITKYYTDHTTAAICSITTTTLTDDYLLDPRIISVKRVLGSWDDIPLKRTTTSYLDAHCPGWEKESADEPKRYIIDRTVGYITLYPFPSIVGTLSLSVIRLPLAQLAITDIGKATPVNVEFPLMWIDNLVDGMLASAYDKPDSQTRNPQMAVYHQNLWTQFLADATSHIDIERQDRAFQDSIGQEDVGDGWDGII